MSKAEIKDMLRREQDILDRLDNVKRLIQMENTLLTAQGCRQYVGYKASIDREEKSFGTPLINNLRDEIQMQLLSITALCYGDNPDVGEPMPMLEWVGDGVDGKHPSDYFRDAWDAALQWNA